MEGRKVGKSTVLINACEAMRQAKQQPIRMVGERERLRKESGEDAQCGGRGRAQGAQKVPC